ncbi:MAG: hypothetical protein ACWIPI_10445, partial [Polaribacter sp.]
GWLIVDSKPVSTGTFTSVEFPQSYVVDIDDLKAATKFVLSIEPAVDSDPKPSNTKILAGDFNGNSANVNSNIVGDFSASSGKYILATPTDGMMNNEISGVWFLTPPATGATKPTVGLELPILKDGWKYEGWAVINGKPVTTGKFTKVAATDEFDGFSGAIPLPKPNGDDGFFPGEDFLKNAPAGQTFPADLLGTKIVISVEPDPDNSAAPFTLKPLAGDVPSNATDHTSYLLAAGPVVSLSGTVKR